jgi:3-deoxy-D-manno-octulosonic-acid transferase
LYLAWKRLLHDLLYLAATPVVVPALVLKSLRTGKYRSGWDTRLGFGPAILPRRSPDTRVLLLHCVSVGELNSVSTLLQKLLDADPRLHVAITTTTDTGTERARKLYPPTPATRVHALRFPIDFSFAVEQLFDRVRPDAIALVELETWPNFLAIAQDRRIPVLLVNGRLSERSFPRYRLIKPLMAAMLRKIAWIGVQTDTIAARFRALGAPARRVQVLPTLKYDNAHVASHVPGQETLAAALGLAPEHRLIVGGSTGPGEEESLLDMYDALRPHHPELRLAIVPRHPEVVAQVADAIRRRGLSPVLRTQRPDSAPPPHPLAADEVFILNTMGELRKMYALAFGVFVGRSLIKKGGGGSDMIEVAALAKPCCFGPFTSNFAEVVERLLAEKTAVEVPDAAALTRTVEDWLRDPAAARDTGRRAQEVILRQRGSTDLYVAKMLEVINRGRATVMA